MISVSKGIEKDTSLRLSQVIEEELQGHCPVVVLSGPSHAEEVGRHVPTGVVAASEDLELARQVQDLFMNPRFRVYTSTDKVGTELCAALKNIIALCAGCCDGMGCGEEARRESALAVRLLERFLRAGVETSGALKTLNSALTLRAEVSESFTTIDLLTLSLRDGAAEVYKYGAAPSYVKRGARVRRITGSCLPAGLQSADTRPETTGFTLEKGSFFVMLSDGVADVNDDGWLMALLEKFQGDDPQALASAILAAGRERRGGDDDCAVLALYRDKDGGAVEV